MCVCAYMLCILGTGATELHEHQPPLPTVRKALEHRQKLEQIKAFDTSFKRGYCYPWANDSVSSLYIYSVPT